MRKRYDPVPSPWVTAEVVRTLSLADPFVSMDHQMLSDSVSWLIRKTQQPDGSFIERASSENSRPTVSWAGRPPLAVGGTGEEQTVVLTSLVLVALHRATSIRDPILQLRMLLLFFVLIRVGSSPCRSSSQFHDHSKRSAANYLSQHALNVTSMYACAVATYALTLQDPSSAEASVLLTRLEQQARQKGNPVVRRYWQEPSVTADWQKPDKSRGQTVEMTAYVLLTVLLKRAVFLPFLSPPVEGGVSAVPFSACRGRCCLINLGMIQYANPVVSWLTQDQHYEEGFYSIKDMVLTLEALTEYSKVVPKAALNQDINIRDSRQEVLSRVQLSRSRPVAPPLQITKNDDIIVSTGYGKGVSSVKMKTVYYQTTTSTQTSCNFDLTIELVGPAVSSSTSSPRPSPPLLDSRKLYPTMKAPHLVACVKYRPPPNEVYTESLLTVMKIQLPTGVEPYLEDLRQVNGLGCFDVFRSGFHGYHGDRQGSLCTKQFSAQQQRLQRLCVGEQCQCMAAACATYRGNVDATLTAAKRTEETCQPHIKYAFKVTVKSSAAEGDFMTYTATVAEVLKKSEVLEAAGPGSDLDLVKKVTCSSVELQNNQQYLVLGSGGSEVTQGGGSRWVVLLRFCSAWSGSHLWCFWTCRYRLPLDSEALVELWPTDCSSPECQDYNSQLMSYAVDLQLFGCP
ncbi:hypothetical protein CCH79_00020214 [Gambusia affinis]|uniref:NTR domain-containing protein n=1 Tax=Gambusia affinis TaxID=33528 RepID=A0A315USW9_GAMAF|nr:hypothetical protein CCH79_00020214 [Gambusia affinis]